MIALHFGERFGRLTVVGGWMRVGTQCHWSLRCDCGATHQAPSSSLRSGRVKSCGCLNAEMRLARNTKHGLAKTPEWEVWQQMIKRCTVPSNRSWKWYGARGIRVCARWSASFADFLSDVGPRPAGTKGKRPMFSLDRINNDGNYEPGNVRWATGSEQALNRRAKGANG